MQVMIRGENIQVTDALEDYTQKKIDKLYRYLPNISEVRVDLSRNHTKRGESLTIAQITLRHERGAILRAEEKIRGEDHDTVQAAINAAVDKMYRQIERFKGKREQRRKGTERFLATEEELAQAEAMPEFEEISEDYSDYHDNEEIVRRKEVALSAMDEQEAIAQMELLGHSFFMFHNANSGEINVLYRREAGGYGVLVPSKM